MSLREDITRALADKSLSAEETTIKLIDLFEDLGFSLEGNGWLDEEDTILSPIHNILENEDQEEEKALKILLLLEEGGLSLVGNGWLDDDEYAYNYVTNSDDEE